MKIFKRILVATLAIALLAAAFSVASFAEEDTREYPYAIEEFDKAEQILEYYTLQDYLADNYDDGEFTEELVTSGRGGAYSVVEDPTDPDNKVLVTTVGRADSDVMYSMAVAPEDALTDKLVVSSRVYFDATAANGLSYNLRIGMQSEKDPMPRYFNLFSFDMKAATFSYYVSDGTHDNAYTKQKVSDWTPALNTWYDVFVVYNAVDDNYKITISTVPADGEDAVVLMETGKISIEGAVAMNEYQLYIVAAAGKDRSEKKCYLDMVEIYEGTTYRNPSQKDEKTRIHINDLADFYSKAETSFADKLRIANVYYFFFNLDPAEFDSTILTDFPEIEKQMNETFAAEIINRVNGIDDTLTYAERVAYIDYIEEYDIRLPENLTDDGVSVVGITADLAKAVEAARATRDTAVVAIEETKEHTENFIDFMTNVYDADEKNYVQMLVWYGELLDRYDGAVEYKNDYRDVDKEVYPYQTRYYTANDPSCKALAADGHNVAIDTEYPGMGDLYDEYLAFCAKFEEIQVNIKEFIIHVESIELATTFGARCEAYLAAKEYYNDGVIHAGLDNDTHEKLAGSIAFYLRVEPSIVVKIQDCELFIAVVEEAAVASYYTTLNEKLEHAEVAYSAIAIDYPGIYDALEVYNELRIYRAELAAAADAYIEAVDAIADAKNLFYAKKDAVDKARELKAAGDVLGYPGVAEANITFAFAEADVNFREGNSTTLISLVKEIAKTKSIEERRVLIRQAIVARDNCEITYEGVVDAKISLDYEIDRFIDDVRAANALIISANDSAAAIAGAVSGVKIFN